MGFTFLHAADLHLGSPLSGLAVKDESVARRVAAAGREALSDLVERAIAEPVAFVVIAGDVYDGEWKDASVGLFFNREMAKLARANIPVFIIKGNHDADSVVLKTISLPESVVTFPSNKAGTHRIGPLKVALHGRSFRERAVLDNLAVTYPDPVPGCFNIGILHTSCAGYAEHETYAPCSPADLVARGYQYWALGHVHEFHLLGEHPHIVYPGNLQGRSIRECGAKGAVFVDVEDGEVKEVRRVIVDRARFAQADVDLTGVDDEATALRRIEEAIAPLADAAGGRLMALRVSLTGATALDRELRADPRRLSDEVQAAAHRRHEDIWLERVRLATTAPEAAAGDGALAALDVGATIDALLGDPKFRAEAATVLNDIKNKLPSGTDAGLGDLDALFGAARGLALGRLER